MSMTELLSFMTAIVIFLFNIFPNSELITRFYGEVYDWASVTDNLEEAVRERDAEALANMASPEMKKKFPDFKERLDAMFSDIQGTVIDVDTEEFYPGVSVDYSFDIETTVTDYEISILYYALDAESKHTEVGIRRIMLTVKTDDTYSFWAAPDHYMASETVNETDYRYTRRWCCAQGAGSDKYVFTVEGGYPAKFDGVNNVNIDVGRNYMSNTTPSASSDLRDGDVIKIYFVPEGENPPKAGERSPDITATAETRDRFDFYIKPGRYYIYAEPNDSEMYYTIAIRAVL